MMNVENAVVYVNHVINIKGHNVLSLLMVSLQSVNVLYTNRADNIIELPITSERNNVIIVYLASTTWHEPLPTSGRS